MTTPPDPRGPRHDPTDLTAATDRLQALVPYLRVSLGPVADDGWLSCGDLAGDPASLATLVRTTGHARGTDDPVVAASLFAQAYAFRVAGTATALWLLTGFTPDLGPATTAIALARARPANVAWQSSGYSVDPDGTGLRDEVVAHLATFVAALRVGTDVGERLVWGNTVTAMAIAARSLHEALPSPVEQARLRARAATFFGALDPPLAGLGSHLTLTEGDRTGWFWERTNCCLNDKIPGAPRCVDCSKTPAIERRAAFRATLAP